MPATTSTSNTQAHDSHSFRLDFFFPAGPWLRVWRGFDPKRPLSVLTVFPFPVAKPRSWKGRSWP
jgi:hypothetical protein